MTPPSAAPRVRVAAVIPVDDRILLVSHTKNRRSYFLLPGGGVEPFEAVGDALMREVLEETGLEVRLVRPLFVSDTIDPDRTRHLVNLTFLAEATGGKLLDSPQDPSVTAVRLVTLGELRSLDLRPPMARHIIEAAHTGFASPARYLGPLWTHE